MSRRNRRIGSFAVITLNAGLFVEGYVMALRVVQGSAFSLEAEAGLSVFSLCVLALALVVATKKCRRRRRKREPLPEQIMEAYKGAESGIRDSVQVPDEDPC